LVFTKGGKSASPGAILAGKKILSNFLYHPYESINFQPAGLLKIALIVTPLLLVYFMDGQLSKDEVHILRNGYMR
jgi:hypothetical protein